jgi:hypothetical protein
LAVTVVVLGRNRISNSPVSYGFLDWEHIVNVEIVLHRYLNLVRNRYFLDELFKFSNVGWNPALPSAVTSLVSAVSAALSISAA